MIKAIAAMDRLMDAQSAMSGLYQIMNPLVPEGLGIIGLITAAQNGDGDPFAQLEKALHDVAECDWATQHWEPAVHHAPAEREKLLRENRVAWASQREFAVKIIAAVTDVSDQIQLNKESLNKGGAIAIITGVINYGGESADAETRKAMGGLSMLLILHLLFGDAKTAMKRLEEASYEPKSSVYEIPDDFRLSEVEMSGSEVFEVSKKALNSAFSISWSRFGASLEILENVGGLIEKIGSKKLEFIAYVLERETALTKEEMLAHDNEVQALIAGHVKADAIS